MGADEAKTYSQLSHASLCRRTEDRFNITVMDRVRIDKALARIEAATARIERAGGRAPADGDSELAARHARLKGTVAASLRELDALIGALER